MSYNKITRCAYSFRVSSILFLIYCLRNNSLFCDNLVLSTSVIRQALCQPSFKFCYQDVFLLLRQFHLSYSNYLISFWLQNNLCEVRKHHFDKDFFNPDIVSDLYSLLCHFCALRMPSTIILH